MGDDIRGWLSDSERQMLISYSIGKIVLEIGSYCGKSTIAMAWAAKIVYALDWHRSDDDCVAVTNVANEDTLPEFWNNIKAHQVRHKIVPLVGRTDQLSQILGSAWADVVFIDGSHNYHAVFEDVGLAIRCLKEHGLIIMHDWTRESVKSAFKDAMAINNITTTSIGAVDSLIVHAVWKQS